MRTAGSLIALVVGCSPYAEQAPNGTTDDVSESSMGGTTTSDDEASTGASDGLAFLTPPDFGSEAFGCDPLAQNCPANQKCMPYAYDGGGTWNGTRCSPIAEDPAGVGDPCHVYGSAVSGLDDCDLGLLCWDVDPETNVGACLPQCTGSANAPVCDDPDRACTQNGGGALNLCLKRCHPLLQDCGEGRGCYLNYNGFLCVHDASGDAGASYDGCEFLNACNPGLVCTSPEDDDACSDSAAGCCKTLCEVGTSGPPCPPLEECVPWEWTDGEIHPELEDIGQCKFPDL